MPQKFKASAQIEMATVGDSSGGSRPIESKDILAEKLKNPSYFFNQTIQICGFGDK